MHECIELWLQRIAREAWVPREDLDRYWAWLEQERSACAHHREEFDRHFTHSNRPNAVPRAGLWLSRRWPQELGARGREDELEQEVRRALDVALTGLEGFSPRTR